LLPSRTPLTTYWFRCCIPIGLMLPTDITDGALSAILIWPCRATPALPPPTPRDYAGPFFPGATDTYTHFCSSIGPLTLPYFKTFYFMRTSYYCHRFPTYALLPSWVCLLSAYVLQLAFLLCLPPACLCMDHFCTMYHALDACWDVSILATCCFLVPT